jgi:molybdopterin-guanine dinucleotide biosynthesis protein A
MSLSAIVLCGGRSARMGRDKGALPFGGETTTGRVVRLVRLLTPDVVAVGHAAPEASPPVRTAGDPGEGPLVALGVGLAAVTGTHVLLVACDMPLVRPPLLGRLVELLGNCDACVPRVGGIPVPTCAVYAGRLDVVVTATLEQGERSLRALLDRVSVRWVDEPELRALDPDLDSFLDCDTPEDYARALRIAGLHEPPR